MALSPEEIQAARKQYGIGQTSTQQGSSFGSTGAKPVDRAALMERLQKQIPPSKTPTQNAETHTVGNGGLLDKALSYAQNAGKAGVFGPVGKLVAQYPEQSKEAAVGTVKGLAQAPIQLTKGLAAEYAGLTGQEDVRQELLKPQNYPVLGEVKQISASPQDIESSNTQTPLETGFQAADVLLSASPLGKEAKEVIASKPGGKQLVETAENYLAKRQAAKASKKVDELAKVVMPKETAAVREAAVASGNVSDKSLLKGAEILPSKKDFEIARDVEGLFPLEAEPAKKVQAIKDGIKHVAEDEVAPVLKKNMRPVNLKTFKAALGKVEMPTMFKADKVLENTYNLIRQRAVDIAADFPKTREGLWAARKKFDQVVEKEFPRVFDGSGSDTAVKHGVADVRKAWNEFIVDGLPEAEKMKVEKAFSRMSNMYTAADNIAEKGAAELGKSGLASKRAEFSKKYPVASEIGKLGAAAVLGGGLYGVGRNLTE